MLRRASVIWLLVTAGAAFASAATEPLKLTYIGDFRQSVGKTVTVRGRTGFKRRTPAPDGCNVYTLRDDYDDRVDVHIRPSDTYPIMGATYDVTGEVRQERDGSLYLEAEQQTKKYGGQATDVVITKTQTLIKPTWWLLPAVGGAVLLGALVVVFAVRAIVRRRAVAGSLATPWGYVEVVSGPHQGLRIALREELTVLGRHRDPVKEVSLDEDRSVSRRHGEIIREADAVYYVDAGSMNGSYINEQPITAGQRVAIAPGTLVRLGANTVLRVDLPEAGDITRALRAENTGAWGEAQTRAGERRGEPTGPAGEQAPPPADPGPTEPSSGQAGG